MSRLLTDHIVNPANDKLCIEVIDEPGSGGASHLYRISGYLSDSNRSLGDRASRETSVRILFQNGPIAEVGVNGVTHEALLAILIDRLNCFQNGPFACNENAAAKSYLEQAQACLLGRTKARMARGVEGTHEK